MSLEGHYKLSLCENPIDHKETPLRYVGHHRGWYHKPLPGFTTDLTEEIPFTPSDIGLNLLKTCRQIYHEAVLRPFSQISFASLSRLHYNYSGVQQFASALIPAQAKAIANLRIILPNEISRLMGLEHLGMLVGPVPAKTTIAKPKSLTNLEIVLASSLYDTEDAVASKFISGLEKAFILAPGVQTLVHARLRSLRVTMHTTFRDLDSPTTPTFAERGQVEMIEAWLRETEMRLHFGSVLAEGAPLPNFGVVQNDDVVRLPPWATPEGREKIRLQEERQVEGLGRFLDANQLG